jgi:hypothetical protein
MPALTCSSRGRLCRSSAACKPAGTSAKPARACVRHSDAQTPSSSRLSSGSHRRSAPRSAHVALSGADTKASSCATLAAAAAAPPGLP